MAMLTIRARRFIKKTGRKLDVNGQRVGFDRKNRRTVTVETPTGNALVAQDEIEGQVCDKFKTRLGYNTASSTTASLAVESFVNSSEMLENQEYNKSKSDKGYHVVPPPYTWNFIPFKSDLTFMDEIVKSENMDITTIVTPSNVKKVESNHESADVKNNGDTVEPKTVRKNSFRPLIIEDWNSDNDSEVEFIPNVKDKTVRPSTEKIKFVKSAREMVEKVIRPVWNNSSRVNHKNFANNMTHPHPNRKFVPQAVLTRSDKINIAGASVNTAVRPVNTAASKPTVNDPRSITNAYKKGHSQVTRPFNKDRAVVSENKGKRANAVKASTCWVWKAKNSSASNTFKKYSYIDARGRSKSIMAWIPLRHMTRNKCYLTEYKDYNGGFVSFGDGKGIISGKGYAESSKKGINIHSAEVVNTACYVLNRVLVIKPHNKTPYELIRGRTPLIDFMKLFGCPVTILNTRDHLGKFDGKVDEGFFVGYFVVSKAMRVFNKRTRIVEETLNIRFLENAPNVTGNRSNWLFDVDSLTKSMNYMPIVTENQTNGISGSRDNIVAGQAEKKIEPEKEYILIPFCTTDPLISQGPKDSEEDEKQTNSTNSFNTVGTPVSVAGLSFTNDDPSSPVNAAEASNAFEDHLFERFSPFKNAFALPHVPNVFSIDDTGIFDNAYDDEDVGV
ncbi:ribonuclease H-like domain-containing protein [Tanacetum coccineum]